MMSLNNIRALNSIFVNTKYIWYKFVRVAILLKEAVEVKWTGL